MTRRVEFTKKAGGPVKRHNRGHYAEPGTILDLPDDVADFAVANGLARYVGMSANPPPPPKATRPTLPKSSTPPPDDY